jgi:hypothetical protein
MMSDKEILNKIKPDASGSAPKAVCFMEAIVVTSELAYRAVKDIERIVELETALQNLIDVAVKCDSWESFPEDAIWAADDALEKQE